MKITLQKYNGGQGDINIGHIIEENKAKIKGKRIMLRICNSVIWGTFIIPTAIGFSTPIKTLGNLTDNDSIIIDDHGEDDALDKYQEWRKIYNTTNSCRYEPTILKYTRDNNECGICLEEYKLGEDLIQLKCAHKFHMDCYKEMDVRAPCPYCRKEAILPDISNMNTKEKILQIMKENGF